MPVPITVSGKLKLSAIWDVLYAGAPMLSLRIVDRDYGIKKLDKDLKNSWKWSWLEKEVKENVLGKYLRKVNVRGLAYCELCKKNVNYAARGWKALEQHVLSKLHQKNEDARRNNYSLSGVFGAGKSTSDATYGIHPMFKAVAKPKEIEPRPITPVVDRTTNAETMILAFTAEHSLSFSVVPSVIELAKTLGKDSKALNSLHMNRTTAGYKTRFGLGSTFSDQVIQNMKDTPFLLNTDESTSNNFQKVLTILVSYFCPTKREVVVNHFASLSCIKVNSQYLFDKIVGLIEKNNIPWRNLMSVLMDSCNIMRWSKSGLETCIRNEKAPHLLNVDGDACHHVHNAAKAFCKPFSWFIEQLFNDLLNDFKWSPDIRELFEEVCVLLNIKYTMPQSYESHRWLSVYDVTVDTLRLFDCFTVFYFALVKEFESTKFLPIVMEIYHRLGIPKAARERIQEIRKVRLFREFLICFIKPEILAKAKSSSKLQVLDIKSSEHLLKPESMFIGTKAQKILKSSSVKDYIGRTFLKNVEEAYKSCGATLQNKLPLTNVFLKSVAAIDPEARGHSLTMNYLQKLPNLAPNILEDNDNL